MSKPIKVVVELAGAEVIGVRADGAEVELLFVDYDQEGPHRFEGQACSITRHAAEEDPDAVQTFAEAMNTDDAEVG